MKKYLSIILAAALFVLMVLPVAASVDLAAPKATVTVDGVREDSYGSPTEVKGMRNGTPGATGTVWSAWDDNYLYYYIEVIDTTPNHEHENAWERDCVEFFTDWDNYKAEGDNKNDDHPYWQVRIASAPNADGQQYTNTINGAGIDEYADNTPYIVKPLAGSDLKGGYILEIALPAKHYGITLKEGMILGVDVQIADNQDGSVRASQAFLEANDKSDSQYSDPSACSGLLKLEAAAAVKAEEPAVETEEPAVENNEPEAPATETPEPETSAPEAVPQTGDNTAIFIMLGAIALTAAVILMKRKVNG